MYDLSLLQEEDLQEIVMKISSKRVEFDEARTQMAKHKASYDEAEREYKQHKEQINTVAEEADSKKVKKTKQNCRPAPGVQMSCHWDNLDQHPWLS